MGKSRFGCGTCRLRRIKCDETTPACLRCTSTGRKCDGPKPKHYIFVATTADRYSSTALSSPTRSLTRSPTIYRSQEENRTFSFYLHQVAPCLAGSQDSTFWQYLVPKICQDCEPARNAVLTISCIFEHPPDTSKLHPKSSLITSQAHAHALEWHSRGLRGFRAAFVAATDPQQLELALLSCILLASIEYASNNVTNAFKLLKSGFEILGAASKSPTSTDVRNILAPMLARQAVLMACFGQMPPPIWFEHFQSVALSPLSVITSLEEARAGLYTCCWKALEFIYRSHKGFVAGIDPTDPSAILPYLQQQEHVFKDLIKWHHYAHLYRIEQNDFFGKQEHLTYSALLMYYHVAYIWLMTCLDLTQMHNDSYTDHFEKIITYAEKIIQASEANRPGQKPPPFSFEMRVVPPLFFAGTRCRHPLLRRKCLNLLRRAPKQEALFAADMNARALERVIGVEEAGEYHRRVETGTWDGKTLPGQEMRCEHVLIHYEDLQGRKTIPKLIYVRGSWRDEHGNNHLRTTTVPLY